MSTIVEVCPTCAPPRVEEKTKYYGIGECQACGAAGVELRGFSLAAVLEALAKLQAPKDVCNDLAPMPIGGGAATTCVLPPGHAGPHTDRAGEYPLLWISSATNPWVYDRDALGAIKDGIERMRQIHRETPHLEIPATAFKPVSVGYCVDDGTRVHPRGRPGIAVVPIADPGPGKHDTHEWDHESQTAKPVEVGAVTPLAWLQANSHFVELELQPQRRNYRSIAEEFETLDGLDAVDEEDLPPAIRAECLTRDSLVVLYVYKDTMVGHYAFYHYDAEACVAEAHRQLSGGGQ